MTFDESNGFQVEQVDLNVLGKEEPPCEAIKHLAIGDVRPVEAQDEDDEPLQASTPLEGTTVPGSTEVQTPRFREIPQRFRETLHLREILRRFQGLGTQHLQTLRTREMISKRMLKQVYLSLKLMEMKEINPYTNLLGHHILVCIKSCNRTTLLTISLEV